MVELEYEDLAGSPRRTGDEIMLTYAPASAVAAAGKDTLLSERAAIVRMEEVVTQALGLEKDGKLREATDTMYSALCMMASEIDDPTMGEYQDLTEQLAMGLTEEHRKQRHSQSYRSRHTRT